VKLRDAERFRARALPAFLFIAVFTQIGYLLIMMPMALVWVFTDPVGSAPGARFWWVPIPLGCLLCGILSAMATPLVVFGFPVYVSPDGLKAYNFWGIYTSVGWDSITAAKTVHFGVAGFLRVFTRDTRLPFWLPLFSANMDRFTELVREYAGPNNPLTIALERHTPSDD
jgi:hypothetical protein